MVLKRVHHEPGLLIFAAHGRISNLVAPFHRPALYMRGMADVTRALHFVAVAN
jgi:hypothetical protein